MKFIKLCQNELIKTMKKTSTIVMIVFTLLAIVGAIAFSYLIQFLNTLDETYTYTEDIDERILSIKNELKDDKTLSEESKEKLKADIEVLEIAKDNNMKSTYANQYWKNDLLLDITSDKYSVVELKLQGAEKKEIDKIQERIDKRIQIIKNGDYSAYIQNIRDNYKKQYEDKNMSQKEYNIQMECLDIKEKYEIGKTDSKEEIWKTTLYEEILSLKNNIANGIDENTRKVLTVEKQKEQEDVIKLDLYRLENNIPTVETLTDSRQIYDTMAISFTSVFISILMLMITGSAISTEISKGTIKFLSIIPAKRWKILLAKIVSAVIILVVLTVIVAVLSDLIGGLAFKDSKAHDYLYVQNGEVKTISHNIYTILYHLVNDITIFVFMLFALMLSVITRNTAMAIGISIATYIGAESIMAIINTFVKMDFIKFIPFNNLNLVDKVFPNAVSYTTMQMASVALNNVSLTFSLSVLGVCAVLMLVTMFDSFNKRDII